MRPGSPGFVGGRLREAREARGLTASSLAELLGVSRQAISQYESSQVTPSPDIAYRIAATLNVPLSFFWLPPVEKESAAIFFRSMSAAAQMDRTTGERRLGWLKHIVSYLQEFLDLPEVHFPDFGVPYTLTALSRDVIEDAATRMRRAWHLNDGPISNVVWLLENNGVIVARGSLDAETLDGLSGWLSGADRPYIFLGTDKGIAARSRFDVAHELGHLVLHRHVERRTLASPSEHRLMEQQADAFASAFLLPAVSFARELVAPTLDAMRTLKPRWMVSIAAMIMRAKDVRLLSEEEARKLWIARTRRGWLRREPLDDEIQVEQPRLLTRSFSLLVSEGVRSADQILEELRLQAADIIELANLPPDFFGDVPPAIRFSQSKNRTSRSSQISATSSILDFPHLPVE